MAILDEGVLEDLAIELDTSLPAGRVIRVLEQLVAFRNRTEAIRLNNKFEFIVERAIELRYIEPGKPDQNAFIERYNRTYTAEMLKAYVFESLRQVREISVE